MIHYYYMDELKINAQIRYSRIPSLIGVLIGIGILIYSGIINEYWPIIFLGIALLLSYIRFLQSNLSEKIILSNTGLIIIKNSFTNSHLKREVILDEITTVTVSKRRKRDDWDEFYVLKLEIHPKESVPLYTERENRLMLMNFLNEDIQKLIELIKIRRPKILWK